MHQVARQQLHGKLRGGLRYRLQKYLTVPLAFGWQEVGLHSDIPNDLPNDHKDVRSHTEEGNKGLLMRLKMRGQLGSQLATPQPLHTTEVLFSQSVSLC